MRQRLRTTFAQSWQNLITERKRYQVKKLKSTYALRAPRDYKHPILLSLKQTRFKYFFFQNSLNAAWKEIDFFYSANWYMVMKSLSASSKYLLHKKLEKSNILFFFCSYHGLSSRKRLAKSSFDFEENITRSECFGERRCWRIGSMEQKDWT